ncbi:hypothetical protein D6C78_01454 [Aureobasidium pullulans]|uniref:Uncharacterized protein n=1 Tax=Aureobasidium pullulans TaxID=5580 RepID=A0A4T0C3C6_AURPU|nr:hypothetical protein D6C78_01454 [Aureobasidium pullulans]
MTQNFHYIMASSSPYSRSDTIAAVTDCYQFYIKLPYVALDALVFALKPNGWPDINTAELRSRGEPDEVINLLRHLPYLEHPSIRGGWTIDSSSSSSSSIQYHKGVCYNNNPDSIKSLPSHAFPIAELTDREGCHLLLDTQTGNITDYNVMANGIEGNWDIYEVYGIYKRHGWPENSFDREECKSELEQYLRDADY